MKSYTDLTQSNKLAEILPFESADMIYPSDFDFPFVWIEKPKKDKNATPCWSIAALLDVLPSSIKDSIGLVYSLNMNKEYIEYSNPNISSLYSAYIHTCGNDNLVDACYEMILKLYELKRL